MASLKPSIDVVFVVGTASPETVQYQRLLHSLTHSRDRPVALPIGGPGDGKILNQLSSHLPILSGDCTLQEVANHAASAKWMIGLDSGLSHVAAAARFEAGHTQSSTMIIYGSQTQPNRTSAQHCYFTTRTVLLAVLFQRLLHINALS